jgi:NADH:ubiquinone oxidoreductase subunit F (NADH-binding)/NADH:ubiquinone oxidoreductase subunit E
LARLQRLDAALGGLTIIIEGLRAIQHQHGYLPTAALQELSERINVPLYHLHGVATFFPHFRLTPPPPVELRICQDMSCHLRGADPLRTAVEARIEQDGPTGVVVGPASCLGQCDRAPAAAVNDHIVTRLTPDSLWALVDRAATGGGMPHPEITAISGPLMMDPYPKPEDRYGALKRLLATRDIVGTIATLKAADLRGLGGAGFMTGLKWELVRNAVSEVKYVVCNADESEPGTIKDRVIMEHLPHLVIEGMILAGVVAGAKTGILYIRHEYEAQIELCQKELDACARAGVIGKRILGSDVDFDLTIFVSPGGYICGEESALIEAIQGNRGEPRNKPPFPGQVGGGLWYKPTVVNNVETFASCPLILMEGAEAFKAKGLNGAPGPKFVGISGDVNKPGVYEIRMGTPLKDVIYQLAGGIRGGKKLKGFAPSGPSSGYLPASMVDVPLDFKSLAAAGSMLGSGAIVVCAEGTCMLDMALNSVRFFKNESCGKCVPCRVGSAKMVDTLMKITHGKGTAEDLATIDELSEAMALASICGLGQIAPVPIQSVIKHFREEIDDHVLRKRCPSGVCTMAG